MTTQPTPVDEYADLPAWCRPGKKVAMFSWRSGQSRDSLSTVTVVRILKTRVVVTFVTRGETVETWVPRAGSATYPLRYNDSHGAGRRLADPASQEVRDAQAVQQVQALRNKIDMAFALRTGSAPKADRKPLGNAADVLELLDELAALIAPVRARLADRLDQEGA